VLPGLAYLTICRFIQLLVQLTRGDTAKDLEILVLRHQTCSAVSCTSTDEPHEHISVPHALLGWHRRPAVSAWTSPHCHTGRLPLDRDFGS
jgi:hypothetical protein